MTTTALYTVPQLKKLMQDTCDWEVYAKFLFHNATLLVDFKDEIANERITYYTYKDIVFYFERKDGEIVTVGTGADNAVNVWVDKGITHVVKTTKLPLGTINSNVHYTIV